MDIKPILFSTDMVQAILDGRKTMTRRIVPDKTVDEYYDDVMPCDCERTYEHEFFLQRAKYQPGDVLWVRETWCKLWKLDENDQTIEGTEAFYYAADGYNPTPFNAFPDEYGFIGDRECPRWRPSIHMPRKACRLFLRVTDVRAERLQDITVDDAHKEGFNYLHELAIPFQRLAGTSFQGTWDGLYTNRGYDWDSNPWVWVYTFERREKPEGWC